MRYDLKKIRDLYISTLTITLVLVMMFTFFYALLNNYQVLITINDYKEAYIEFGMMIIYIFFIFWRWLDK